MPPQRGEHHFSFPAERRGERSVQRGAEDESREW